MIQFSSNLTALAKQKAKRMPLADYYRFKQNSLQEKCLILLSTIILAQTVLAIYVQAYTLAIYLFAIAIFFAVFGHTSIRYKQQHIRLLFHKPSLFGANMALLFVVFYFVCTRDFSLGLYLYYFPIMIAVPFFYDCHCKKYIIPILLSFVLIIYLHVSKTLGFPMFDIKMDDHIISVYYHLCYVTTLLFVFLLMYFIYRKENMFISIYHEQQKIQDENHQLEKISQGSFDAVLNLAQENSPQFINEFINTYPDFVDHLDENYSQLTPAELKLCAYIRLNFSTKDVASICDISIRTVQNTKYSIRKKFQIESNEDIYEYIQGI